MDAYGNKFSIRQTILIALDAIPYFIEAFVSSMETNIYVVGSIPWRGKNIYFVGSISPINVNNYSIR
jgi:hypothetical protein